MSNPPNNQTIQDWIQLSQGLKPIEMFYLIGLTELDPHLGPKQVEGHRIVGEHKGYAAQQWATKHFRAALRVYCKATSNLPGQLAVGAGSAIISSLATAGLGLTIGGATGFFAWAVSQSVGSWCQAYGSKRFEGDGQYSGDVPTFYGHFIVNYVPAIAQMVRDPANYPFHKIDIQVPEESTGQFWPKGGWREIESIQECFRGNAIHVFDFTDMLTGKKISGCIDSLNDTNGASLEIGFRGQIQKH